MSKQEIAVSGESSSRRKLMETLTTTYFPDDLWFQIFLYLPLNSVFKFKIVSEVWNSHLSSPDFIHKWMQFNKNNTSLPWMLIHIFKQNCYRKFSIAYLDSHSQLISNHSGFSFDFLSWDPNSNTTYHTPYFLGSSNGLVLFLRNTLHYVCNPLTQKWVQLPPSRPQNDHATITGFVCDCFSLPTTSYKVVRILLSTCHYDDITFNIQVFSSDSGKWNFYEVFCNVGVYLAFPQRAFPGIPTGGVIIHSNVLYWIHRSNRIVAYNLENNESDVRQCRLIGLPSTFERALSSTSYLGESKGSIFYVQINTREETLCVWVLEEDQKFHLLHDTIDLHDLFVEMDIKLSAKFDGIRRGRDLIEVLGFSPVDSNVVIIGCKNYIWAYNTGTRKYDELCHPSFLGNVHSASDIVYLPLVMKPMPTILPPCSW